MFCSFFPCQSANRSQVTVWPPLKVLHLWQPAEKSISMMQRSKITQASGIWKQVNIFIRLQFHTDTRRERQRPISPTTAGSAERDATRHGRATRLPFYSWQSLQCYQQLHTGCCLTLFKNISLEMSETTNWSWHTEDGKRGSEFEREEIKDWTFCQDAPDFSNRDLTKKMRSFHSDKYLIIV